MNNIFKTTIVSLLVIVTFTVSSCSSEDVELSQSVYIEDYDAPGLPIYSEWGYNTFGMYIDKTPFVSTNEFQPSKIYIRPDTFNIDLKGKYGTYSAVMRISLKGFTPNDYPDLVVLNDSLINLKSNNCVVTLDYNGIKMKLDIIQGDILFKKVQKLYVDKELVRTNLSGKIQIKTFINNEPVSINNGRFDLGIGYNNFFNLIEYLGN
ncbi:MAG: hypothetical protein BGO29_07970 [Bacteroidales bacterium 36-12]|nr:MAG: hypothetical protein BGO29_07970 [Bacteroidales bacterium 36-12]